MRKLALVLCLVVLLGAMATGVLAKKMGSGNNGNGYGKGGRFGGEKGNKGPQGSDFETEGNETEGNETEGGEIEGNETEGAEPENKVERTPKYPADHNGLYKTRGQSRHLYLYEKDDEWTPIARGAWGKMTYKHVGRSLRFVFNGRRL
jgi:hypothetical protein